MMKNSTTQINIARQGEISDAVRAVSKQEQLTPEFIRDEVARGRIVIPANPNHRNLIPIGIGKALRTKINANIGNSALSSGTGDELEKLNVAIKYGADTVMDLSTGEDVNEIRARILEKSTVPVGTVPIYQAANGIENPADITIESLLETIEFQARQGVDYMTLHAGLLRDQLPAAAQRLLGIVSRGGSLLAAWMTAHDQENPLYLRFDDILEICGQHDVTLSLGDGMRPGCLADASDEAQFAELNVLAELVRRSRAAGVQAMVEGPGHVPIDEIEMNMKIEDELCDGAPFYILGPVVTDCAPGYDHITSAIGGALGAFHGAAMLCYVTPKEHLGLPNARDVREGVIAYKIAAHAADIGRKKPGAREPDDAISRARANLDWERQMELALDPDRAREYRREALEERHGNATQPSQPPATCPQSETGIPDEEFCSMCGPEFCSLRISRDVFRKDGKTK